MSDMEAARKAMIEKRFGGNKRGASTGGAGTVRRKNKGVAKAGGDDKKLGGVLKKMGMTDLKGVEEVNIIKEDGTVIHITSPKIQASVPSNTYVVTGTTQMSNIQQLMPGILPQLGDESADILRMINQQQQQAQGVAGTINEEEEEDEDSDDDEVPDLVENFEEAAAK
eukprot:CAMPEP_0181309350 /NCGR_PEP_ID=MMETSP1101-20121128/11965_1 /TAXON_ID=46948 /ORGANISM="Rhodomonas abbreviata, Strain Caron Lab Isolate" /LENGTH=167 /DNA_ID=CAMNT_0023415825 /DNA_START=26 /DNA_END=529 /DNA_ORIENTATION=+